MINGEHPEELFYKKNLIAIGYWKSGYNPELPDPRQFIDPAWDPIVREKIIHYLDFAEDVEHWFGYSPCRICNQSNGSTCKSDGVYVWPSGFSHYVMAHNLRVCDQFILHALSK